VFKKRRKVGAATNDASWLAWPTMAESRQSWPTVGSNFRADDVKSAIAKYGRQVMVRYEVETEGEYRGRAVRCWVGQYQVGTVESAREAEFRGFIERMASGGLPATARARFDRSPTSPRLWMVGKTEPRSSWAPFLPPFTQVTIEMEESVGQHIDELLGSKPKTGKATGLGTLSNVQGRSWLAIPHEDKPVLTLPGAEREYVDEAIDADFPATCWVSINRRPGKPLIITVDVPDEREFGPSVIATIAGRTPEARPTTS
jgi:hypothetical protein